MGRRHRKPPGRRRRLSENVISASSFDAFRDTPNSLNKQPGNASGGLRRIGLVIPPILWRLESLREVADAAA